MIQKGMPHAAYFILLQVTFLSMLCYNCGVDSYKKQRSDEAIIWLKKSFETGKMQNPVCAKSQVGGLWQFHLV
jgi:hypothetical protein